MQMYHKRPSESSTTPDIASNHQLPNERTGVRARLNRSDSRVFSTSQATAEFHQDSSRTTAPLDLGSDDHEHRLAGRPIDQPILSALSADRQVPECGFDREPRSRHHQLLLGFFSLFSTVIRDKCFMSSVSIAARESKPARSPAWETRKWNSRTAYHQSVNDVLKESDPY